MIDRILNQMVRLNVINRDDEEIYRFGLEAVSLKLIHYSSYLIIAVLLHEGICFLIFFTAFLLLRKSAGGCHAKTKGGCYVCSCLMVFCTLLCMKGAVVYKYVAPVGEILLLAADVSIYQLAPLGNRNRMLDEEEIFLFRKRTIVFLVLENLLVMVLGITGKTEYAIPIVFALGTEAGLLILEKIRVKKINRNGIYK